MKSLISRIGRDSPHAAHGQGDREGETEKERESEIWLLERQ